MPKTKATSPARSQGGITTPKRKTSRGSRSLCSPALSTASGRLTSLIDEFKDRNMESFALSPLNGRSVLNDNTEIEEPRRKSWWKKLDENSQDVMEVLEDNKLTVNNPIEEFIDIEVLSQEKKNYTLDLPESSDNESINSIVLPQRRLFTQKENQPQKKFGHLIDNRESLAKLHKTNNTNIDKTVNVGTRELFQNAKRTKPIFPAALLNVSPNKTAADKTRENALADPKPQVRSIFGNRPANKRKNMFADFIVSESEDEIPDIQPKVFGFQKKLEQRRISSVSRGREASPTSSITTDIEMDFRMMLPSSTMVENQLEDMVASTPVKRARLTKLSEAKESEAGTLQTNTISDKTKHSNKSVSSMNKTKGSPAVNKSLNNSRTTRSMLKNTSKREENVNTTLKKDEKGNKSKISSLSKDRSSSKSYTEKRNATVNKYQNENNSKINSPKAKGIECEENEANVVNAINNVTRLKNKSTNRSLPNTTTNKSVNEKERTITQVHGNVDKTGLNEMVDEIEQEEDEFNFTLEYENDEEIIDEVEVSPKNNKTVALEKGQETEVNKTKNKSSLSNKSAQKLHKASKTVEESQAEHYSADDNIDGGHQDKETSTLKNQEMDDATNNSCKDMTEEMVQEQDEKVNESQENEDENDHQDNVDISNDQNKSQDVANQSQEIENVENENNEEDEDDSQNEMEEANNDSQEVENESKADKDQGNESQGVQDDKSESQEVLNESQVVANNEVVSDDENNQSNKIEPDVNKSQEVADEIQEEEDEDLANESQDVADESQEEENEDLANESREVADKSQEQGEEDLANESDELADESQEEEDENLANENQEVADESQEKGNEDLANENQEVADESQEEGNEDLANEGDKVANEIQEKEDLANESQEVEAEENESQEIDEEANESQEIEDEVNESLDELAHESQTVEDDDAIEQGDDEAMEEDEEETANKSEVNEASVNESQEVENNEEDSDVESEAEIDESEQVEDDQQMYESDEAHKAIASDPETSDQDDNQADGMEIDDEQESDNAEESEQNEHVSHEERQIEIQNEIEPSEEIEESPNVTHDTTGRHRKKDLNKSPEVILHDKTNQMDSFTAKGRNTSVRKTKSMIKSLNIKPSLAPHRDSTGFSDGTTNSSAEGSGWDSHRTTRKTLRQTFGKDFTPRKSLRALVMEKSAKRQTEHMEMHSETTKFPLANSTEMPEDSNLHVEDIVESDHELSRRTRQTTLEQYLQKIKEQNINKKLKMEAAIRNSLKTPVTNSFSLFKVPNKPAPRRPKPTQNKPKKQINSIIPFDELPAEVIEDMKYKPPKRFQPTNASWITKRLYKFLETKLEPKYDYKARVRAEKLVETIYFFTKDLRRHDLAPTDAVDVLKLELARLDIVKTHFEFYEFFHQFMPREVRVKVVPDVVNNIAVPRHGVFSDILRGNGIQG